VYVHAFIVGLQKCMFYDSLIFSYGPTNGQILPRMQTSWL